MQRINHLILAGAACSALLAGAPSASAQGLLGSARSFAVLGASTVTNTGTSVVTGNLGLSPGSALTGFPPGVVIGTVHVTDGAAVQAQSDANIAYNALAGAACDVNLTGQDLGGLTLVPGVYCFTSSAQLTGALTLNALGSPASVFVFQIGSTLTTAGASSVTLINGGTGCNVFWQVGTSATLGTSTVFVGNILASASITLTTTATVSGSVLALTGAVTMDSNAVTIPAECQCTGAASVTDLGPGCGAPAIPFLTGAPPGIGQTASLTVTSVFPSAMVMLFMSDCGATPFVVPGTPCPVYLDSDSIQLFVSDMTDSGGNWSLVFGVPLDPALVGRCFAIQALVWSNTGPLAGDNLTNGLQVIIGCS